MHRREAMAGLGGLAAAVAAGEARADGHGHPAGPGDKGLMAPVANVHLHFCGIHCAKKDPRIQVVTQHYCAPLGADMHQCLLYESCDKGAKLLGVEYIVTDAVYRTLPGVEKRYWHPHTYEVLAGGLIAPGMAAADEAAFMTALLTTWGKTWHTWPDPASPVPLGEPVLMWALTGDGQDDPAVVAARDKQFGVSIAEVRKRRVGQIGLEVPAVPAPKSVDVIGRQWTAAGEDKPTKR